MLPRLVGVHRAVASGTPQLIALAGIRSVRFAENQSAAAEFSAIGCQPGMKGLKHGVSTRRGSDQTGMVPLVRVGERLAAEPDVRQCRGPGHLEGSEYILNGGLERGMILRLELERQGSGRGRKQTETQRLLAPGRLVARQPVAFRLYAPDQFTTGRRNPAGLDHPRPCNGRSIR